MSSSSSSVRSQSQPEPLSASSSSASIRTPPPPLPSSASSRVSAGVSALESSTSASNQLLFAKYRLGAIITGQTNPRLQAIVVAHHTSASGAPLLSVLQTGYYDRCTQEWHPARLRERFINRLPQQQPPPDHTFADVSQVQQQVLQLILDHPSRQLAAEDFDEILTQLAAQQRLPPPAPILLDTASDADYAPESAIAADPPRRHTVASATPPAPAFLATPPPAPHLTDLAKTVEALSQKLADIDFQVRSSRSAAPSRRVDTSPPHRLVSSPAPPPEVPGLPPVHPQLLVDCSPRELSRSRSRSRSHSRRHHTSVRQYSQIYVPCPFQDCRQSMTPAARAKGSAPMRKLYRNILSDCYSFYPSATRAAKDILLTSQTATYRPPSWEEQQLLNYAYLLDLFLLQTNSGSWTLWSEPGIDWLVRSFLEMAVRVSPKKEPPEFLDPYLAGRVRRLKYGENKKFGLVTTPNNNKNNNRRNNASRPNPSLGVLGAAPTASGAAASSTRRAPVPSPSPGNV